MRAGSNRKICPEFQVVVAATSWPVTPATLSHLQTLLNQLLDWDHFLAVVRRHRVAGLVHLSLSRLSDAEVPLPVLAALETGAARIAMDNMLALRETRRLCHALDTAGVDAMMLKGIALSVIAYGNLGARHSKDIDLLIDPSQVETADTTLSQLGYDRTAPPTSWPPSEVDDFRQLRSHFEYVHRELGVQVELHWRPWANQRLGVQPIPALTGQTVQLGGGIRVRTLNLVDLLEYLCIHGALHAWSRLKWLADVAALLRNDPGLTSKLRTQSARHGTLRPVEQAFLLCEQLYGLKLSSGDPTFVVRVLATVAVDAMTTGCAAGELLADRLRNTEVHASHFLLSSKPSFLWAELRNELLVPPAWADIKPTAGRRLLHRFRGIRFTSPNSK